MCLSLWWCACRSDVLFVARTWLRHDWTISLAGVAMSERVVVLTIPNHARNPAEKNEY
jgi:hypothetical protein